MRFIDCRQCGRRFDAWESSVSIVFCSAACESRYLSTIANETVVTRSVRADDAQDDDDRDARLRMGQYE